MIKTTSALSALCMLVSCAMATETVNFTAIPSQGGPGIMSYVASVTGGFSMGALDWSGIATPINGATFGSELRADISGPLGSASNVLLGTGTTFGPGTPFSGNSNAFQGAGDPAGNWTFDFYESFDDGFDLLPDATWDTIDFTFVTLPPFNLLETYTSLASFQADLAGSPAPLMEDFNTYTYGSFTGATLPLTNGSFTAELLAAPLGGLFSGNMDMSVNTATDSLIIDVSNSPTPVTMIGGDFYGGDINAIIIPANVTITLQDGSTETFTTSSAQFRGFRTDPSTPITQIAISTDDPGGVANVWPSVDNLVVGVTLVPEPTSITLLAIVGAFFCTRRR